MNRIFAILFITLVPFFATAQKKTFSFNEIFKGDYPAIFSTLPKVDGWIDDDHYLEVREQEGKTITMSVEASSGKTSPYSAKNTAEAPEIADAENETLSPDGKYLAYTRNNNLFVRELGSGSEKAITNDGSQVILNGYASWVYYEEILGRASHYKAFWWSPDSKNIAFMRFDDSQVPLFPIYFADGQHGFLEQQRYPKVGDKNPEVKIAVVSINDHKTVWTDFDPKHDQYFGTPQWTNENELFIQWMNREQDSLIVYNINKSNGSKKIIYTETQPTWISLDDESRFFFLKAGKKFILKSDKDGWQNLYLHDGEGRILNAITTGNFWGTSILSVDEKTGDVLFTARKDNSARFDVYRVSLKGGKITRLTFGDYSHDGIQASPTGKYFISTYSNLSTPPAMALIDNKGKVVRTIATTATPAIQNYALPVTKLITVKSSDGLFDLPVTITYPINFDSSKKYPVWISIYGGPNSGTVYDRWKPSGGMLQWWAQEGVIQVAMDNRSSGHFGKKGMNYIFKQMGKWELEDYMSCAKWLGKQSWVDATKMGITGGSFGGYVTCMALTYGAEVFTHGIANYSVTDWQLYDTHYTERFMNTPATNKEGYRSTSVLSYIDRYKGKLRIVHGTTDDNVHLQNSIQVINAMQDKRKNFELMLYPNQRHGISGGKGGHNMLSTIEFIYKNMLEKKMPSEFGW